jgi:thymidylate synthase ThyX
MIKAEIIADSVNPKGNRLTTFILEYPRFVHAELMTHRMFSKNAASSRAIPIEKMIQNVLDNPAMPVWWGKNQSGMQAKEELSNAECIEFAAESGGKPCIKMGKLDHAKFLWLDARDKAIASVKALNNLGLHKQIANRILEPWFNIRIILSGTEFENFFALRVHPDAQPEIQELARQMLELYNTSTPKALRPTEWHIPFGDKFDEFRIREITYKKIRTDLGIPDGDELHIGDITPSIIETKLKIAIARCARISYFNYEGKDDYAADITLCDRLFGSIPRHLSPTEHVAQAQDNSAFIGNFRGFKQYRYTFADQNLSDPRVIKK